MFVVVVIFLFIFFFWGGGGGGIPLCQISSTELPSLISPSSSSSLAVRHESPSSDPVQGRERDTGGAVFPGCHASTYGEVATRIKLAMDNSWVLSNLAALYWRIVGQGQLAIIQVPQTCTLLL